MSPSPVLPFGPAALAFRAATGELRLDAAVTEHTRDVEQDGGRHDRDGPQDELVHRPHPVPVASQENGRVGVQKRPEGDDEVRGYRQLLALVDVLHIAVPSLASCVAISIANHKTINVVRQVST